MLYTQTYDLISPSEGTDLSELGFVVMGQDIPMPDGLCGEGADQWKDEQGVHLQVDPQDWSDPSDPLAPERQMARIIIEAGCTETHSSPSFYQPEGVIDMRTGASRTEAIHLVMVDADRPEGWADHSATVITALVDWYVKFCRAHTYRPKAGMSMPPCAQALFEERICRDNCCVLELIVEVDDVSIAGSFATGDDEEDARIVKEIERQLAQGNTWAWAFVRVRAMCNLTGWVGEDSCGGGNYDSEAQFYLDQWEDMVRNAVADLNRVRRKRIALSDLVRSLSCLA
jgi:hypothetical protein